jgi:membrane protease YdiL (CAAX protease family)
VGVDVRAILFFLAEAVGFTLLLRALMAPLWGLAGSSFPAILGVWLLYAAGAVLVAAILSRLRRGQGVRALGFRYHQSFRADVWFGILGYAILYLVSLPFDIAALADRTKAAEQIMAQLSLSSLPAMLAAGSALALVTGFVSGALHEEIRFRGYYQGAGQREITPLAGCLIALIPFTGGHYFSHADWSLAQVSATLLPAIVYGLLYNATGSLTVVITAHTLSNWISSHPALLAAATKSRVAGIAAAGALALLFLLLLVFRGRRQMRLLVQATVRMLRDRPAMGLVSGAVVGLVLLATWPLRWSPLYSGLAGVLLVGVSLLGKRRQPAIAGRPTMKG